MKSLGRYPKRYRQLKEIEERTTEAENRIAATEHTCETVDARVQELENQIRSMAEHIDDLENRGRRKNVRVIGLPEDAEGTNPTKFFESWIPDLLGLETKAGRVKIERAHRTLAPKPGPNQRPRPVLIRFHNFTDKQRVLDASRRSGTVKYKESTIMFFQDLSAAVLRKRKGFDEVKKRLRDTGAKYMMLYPATLKIIHGGEATTPPLKQWLLLTLSDKVHLGFSQVQELHVDHNALGGLNIVNKKCDDL
ncbi:hypothetical protein D5F01_LYC08911 [Larimichthys crocea]|uniref:LINE-1 type transposase domain-containing protein 1 n=1 Tax=Larimichthys crocea TaxID=215358 RepID=A0A6G0IJP9_LARCR|nr:hypothetical protein D5F01_LYC08911 [Larimichthys crocea]